MTAVYPTTVKGFTTRVDYIDNVLAVHINDLQDEVNAIEGIIGNLPQVGSGWIGSFDQVTTTWTNVKSRISNIEYGITSVLTKVLPAAGTTGQVLQKTSNADYAVGWTTLPSTIAIGSVTGLGTGVATALAVNVGTAGAPVILGGAGGTPSSLTLTNAAGLPESGVTNLTTDLAAKAPLASPTFTGVVTIPAGTIAGANNAGYMGIPQNGTTTGSYTLTAADNGTNIRASATRTVTIDSNANLALPIGFATTFTADSGATMTIAITTDTMYLAGPGTTGSRTLAPFGMATAIKQTATTWMISGNGLT